MNQPMGTNSMEGTPALEDLTLKPKGDRSAGSAMPTIGMNEWFRTNDHDLVEKVLADMRTLAIQDLRTGISWADYHNSECREWYDWLFRRLAREVRVLPCFLCTPESLGISPKTSAPPKQPKAYGEFIEVILHRFGRYFDWIELWNEPNNLYDWDWRLDPEWRVFCEMVLGGARIAHELGKKTVLAGMCPTDINWLQMMFERRVMDVIDAVGVHGFPGTWEFDWDSWCNRISKVRRLLEREQRERKHAEYPTGRGIAAVV